MKKRSFLLVFILLLFTSAWAEFDLSPYTYEANTAQPLGGGQVLLQRYAPLSDQLEIWEDGILLTERNLKKEYERQIIQTLVRPDGRIALVYRYPEASGSLVVLDSQLEPQNTLDVEANQTIFPLGDGFATCMMLDDTPYLVFTDENAHRFQAHPFDARKLFLCGCSLLPSGRCAVIFDAAPRGENRENFSLILAVFSPDGQKLWQKNLPGALLSNYAFTITETPGGTLIFTAVDSENFMISHLYGFSPAGEEKWHKILSADRLVVDVTCGETSENGVLLHGRCVANSRGIFETLTIEVDEDGHLLNTSFRDFSAAGDYHFRIVKAPDGEPFVCMTDGPRADSPRSILAPLSALPEGKPHKITLN